jgi:hypothetical protein
MIKKDNIYNHIKLIKLNIKEIQQHILINKIIKILQKKINQIFLILINQSQLLILLIN